MFTSRKRNKLQSNRGVISETVAGVGRQVDALVYIVQDSNASPGDRIAAAEVVRSLVEFQSMSSISEIWYATQTLLNQDNVSDVRRAGWRLTLSCMNRDELNNSSLSVYYSTILVYANVDDFDLVLACLSKLTVSGRRIIGSQTPRNLTHMLIMWIQQLAIRTQDLRSLNSTPSNTMPGLRDVSAEHGGDTAEESFHKLLEFTASCLKFNMYVWEPKEIEKLLLTAVAIIRRTSDVNDCRLCCLLIETVIAYGLVPASVLQPILEVLCALITLIPQLRDTCKSIIISLSDSHLRNVTYIRLCCILDTPTAEITTSMREAAALELTEFLVKEDAQQKNEDDGITSSTPSITKSILSDPMSSPIIGEENYTSVDVSLPILEVLEAYYRTLCDIRTPLSLVVTLLECMLTLITKVRILHRVYLSSIPNSGSPSEMIKSFSDIYARNKSQLQVEENNNAETNSTNENLSEHVVLMEKYSNLMSDLAAIISGCANDRLGVIDPFDQILSCLRLSDFLDQTSCRTLLGSIVSLQFCTPGITGWDDRLQEVVERLYVNRKDSCKLDVLHIVENAFTQDSYEEGWVSEECLNKLAITLFSQFDNADDDLVSALQSIYVDKIFYSLEGVFMNTSILLSKIAVESQNSNAALRAVDTLIDGFASGFLLWGFQSAAIVKLLMTICLKTLDKPDIFARGFSVISRLRVDAWDRLLMVEKTTEPFYGRAVESLQEPLPEVLVKLHSVHSLVLSLTSEPDDGKSSNSESNEGPNSKFETGSYAYSQESTGLSLIPVLQVIVSALRNIESKNERTVALALMNAASLLTNYRIFDTKDEKSLIILGELKDILIQTVASGGSKLPKNMAANLKQASIGVSIHVLNVLLPYKKLFTKAECDVLIHTLVISMNQSVFSTSWVVNCFTVSCYECPSSVQRFLPQILSQMQLKITNRECSMYILDFLLSLSLEGSLTKNFTEQDFKRVFGMCFLFIQNANDSLTRLKNKGDVTAQWLLRLAYSAISNLFLSMPLRSRKSLVSYLVRSLVLANNDPTSVDPSSLVVYDMINMFAYSDVPSRMYADLSRNNTKSSEWDVKRWLRGVVIIEIQTNRRTGESNRIIRRPAGVMTTIMKPAVNDNHMLMDAEMAASEDHMLYSANYYMLCGQLALATFPKKLGNDRDNLSLGWSPSSLTSSVSNIALNNANSSNYDVSNHQNGSGYSAVNDAASFVSGLSPAVSHTDLKSSAATITQEPLHSKEPSRIIPMAVPDDPQSNRAISSIDRVPIVDFYKIGIIYVAPNQCTEEEILSNSSGSVEYRNFLAGIGSLIRLKNNKSSYVGGLDTDQDLDGKYAIAWSSKIQQIIFHTITMMPTVEGDSSFSSKKRHIGNNFVNIYFDESGLDFEFDVVQSQFNFINIVITPASYAGSPRYWKVRAYRKDGMKNTLAAYEAKVIRDDNLTLFARNLCLKASQYASIHHLGGEYMDNWVYRLNLIEQLSERLSKLETQKNNQELKENETSSEFIEFGKNEEDIALANWMDFTRFTV